MAFPEGAFEVLKRCPLLSGDNDLELPLSALLVCGLRLLLRVISIIPVNYIAGSTRMCACECLCTVVCTKEGSLVLVTKGEAKESKGKLRYQYSSNNRNSGCLHPGKEPTIVRKRRVRYKLV